MLEIIEKLLNNNIEKLYAFTGFEPNLKFIEAVALDNIKNLKILRNPQYSEIYISTSYDLFEKRYIKLIINTETKINEYYKKIDKHSSIIILDYSLELQEAEKLKPLNPNEIKEIIKLFTTENLDEIIDSIGNDIYTIYEVIKMVKLAKVDSIHILELFEKPYFDNFIKAVVLNDKKLIFQELKKKIEANEKPYYIFASIFWVTKKLMEAGSFESVKKSFFKIKEEEFKRNKKLLDINAIKKNIKLIADLDASYKYGSIDGYTACELLAINLWS
ncbi:MAG: hypothetical protein NZ870_04060 [bacterium]|nr:hypothetical protein [bacterium]